MRISTVFLCLLAFGGAMISAQPVPIDTARSTATVHVQKSGLFSAFAHNHVIQAPIASGQLDFEKRATALSFSAKQMRVLDEGIKDSERAEIDETMKSDKVLDVQRFPEIKFASTVITAEQSGHYRVRGELTLHGVTKPVELLMTEAHDRYSGSIKMKQTDFGITPVSIAGGTVKVKDVIEITFEIVPARGGQQ